MKDIKIIILIIICLLQLGYLHAQKLQSDNGDGTYTNPLIFADFPDPDVIRVGDTYYMVTTTMFVFPGITILKSNDLVNWEYCNNAVPRMDFSPCYNLENCNRYAHGQWATSFKYNKGIFYLFFMTLDEGGFICSTTKPEDTWKIKKLPRGFYDPGLFFDEDGKIYVAHGYETIKITELDSSFIARSNDVEVFKGDLAKGLEGTHIYKINGYYYLYSTYGGPVGFQVALRSKNIYGSYEEKVVIRDTESLNKGVHQGALIQTQTGEWWTILFTDNGPFGRMPSLQPVHWEDNWPIAGINGKGVVTYKKPNVGKKYPVKVLPTSDEFNSSKLGAQWSWNHNPEPLKWSLAQSKGNLRLSTVKVVNNLREARNTLTQRILGYYSAYNPTVATTKVTTNKMLEGDIAGLAIFQDPYAYIGVKKENGIKYIIMVNNGTTIDSVVINQSTVYLKVKVSNQTRKASFSYSLDNHTFSTAGDDLFMKFNLSIFTGNKFCLFNYATKSTGGFVDFDWFRMKEEVAKSK